MEVGGIKKEKYDIKIWILEKMSRAFNILSKGIKEEKSFTIETETGRIIRQGATALKLSECALCK